MKKKNLTLIYFSTVVSGQVEQGLMDVGVDGGGEFGTFYA